ncbi:MAG: DNA-binding response regulator [Acidobacteria bacterium]|nr:MAG: DNA-binding response regulator [Acidobacteriota bacterium]
MSRPKTRERIRLLIADDERLFREGLRVLLETEPGFEVVGYAADGAQTIDLAKQLNPDVLLLDVAMPRMGGLDTLRALKGNRLHVKTILVTGSIDRTEVLNALQLGAHGVVLKGAAPELLFKSIHVAMRGEYWVDRTAVSDLIAAFREASPLPDAPAAQRPFGLTEREFDIVIALTGGLSNKEIAQQLGISEETVKHHLTKIYDKVGASTRLELALFAKHHGLV